MRFIIILTFITGIISCGYSQKNATKTNTSNASTMSATSFYDLTATDIDGKVFKMADLKGKKVMIVNVASRCGYTGQYKQLQELYNAYQSKGLVILGFPCNQFMGQEPGDETDIKSFCQKNYGVTFPMFSKIDVKGAEQHPLYQWLTKKAMNGVEDSEVSWNFNKYLIDENGNYVKHLKSSADPLGSEVLDWLAGK